MNKVEKEPVSADLEQEIERYIGFPEEIDEDVRTTMIRKAARHFAEWGRMQYQKEKVSEDLQEELQNFINDYGPMATIERCAVHFANWQKQQMIKEAVYEKPSASIKDSMEVSSRMKYIDEDLKPIADFILDYAKWNLHKKECNHPTLEVPLFRVLDALIQRGKQYCEGGIANDNRRHSQPKAQNSSQVAC